VVDVTSAGANRCGSGADCFATMEVRCGSASAVVVWAAQGDVNPATARTADRARIRIVHQLPPPGPSVMTIYFMVNARSRAARVLAPRMTNFVAFSGPGAGRRPSGINNSAPIQPVLANANTSLFALFQAGDVDDEAIAHVALDHALIGFVDLADGDHLDIGRDTVVGAEVEHLLGLADPADE
jgi:hypothetical protein